MGAPFEGNWSSVTEAYYVGAGGGEVIWMIIAIALCVGALFVGARHETQAYAKTKK